jgi:hypothetical protein
VHRARSSLENTAGINNRCRDEERVRQNDTDNENDTDNYDLRKESIFLKEKLVKICKNITFFYKIDN